jgi:hypothetical protein
MDVTLPNGVVIRGVPDNATKEQIKQKAIANGLAKEEDFPSAPKAQEGAIQSGFLMGLKDPITAGAQMLPRGLEFLTSAGGMAPNVVSQFFGREASRVDEMAKAEEAAYQEARKARGDEGFDLSRLGGNVLNPANIAVGLRAGRLLGGATKTGQAVAGGAATGVLQPALSEDGFAEEKAGQAAGGAVGGALGSAATMVLSKVANPLISKAEKTMKELGVQLTPGQILGGQFKDVERFAEVVPLVGSYISNAKERAIFQFNKGVINKALGKVDEKLPADVIGRDAVQEANKIIDTKYDEVLSRVSFRMDPKAYNDGIYAINKAGLNPSQKTVVVEKLDSIVLENFRTSAKVDGQVYKGIESDLRKEAMKFKNSNSAAEQDIGEALFDVLESLKKNLRRQNPSQTSALRRVDNAYGDIAVMKTAAANSGAANGVFTPKQYSTAVRQRDSSRNKTAFAAGSARGQDVSDAAVEKLGDEMTQYQTGRQVAQGLGLGAALSGGTATMAAGFAAPALYSEGGLKVMQALLRERPAVVREIGKFFEKRATKEGSITGAQVMAEYNRLTKTSEEQ